MSPSAAAKFSYAVKFVCGFADDDSFDRVVSGRYATAINIFNPNERDADLDWDVAFTWWGGTSTPPGFAKRDWKLRKHQAREVDCAKVFLNGTSTYYKGIVYIISNRRLDIATVYTAAENNSDVTSIDVVQYWGREIKSNRNAGELDD